MKTTESPKWLIEGARALFNDKYPFLQFLTEAITAFGSLYLFIELKYGNWTLLIETGSAFYIILAGYLVATFIGGLIYKLIIKRAAGNSLKWQKAYLQKNIEEYNSYFGSYESMIAEIQKAAEQQISEINKNLEKMKEKSEKAANLLIQFQ